MCCQQRWNNQTLSNSCFVGSIVRVSYFSQFLWSDCSKMGAESHWLEPSLTSVPCLSSVLSLPALITTYLSNSVHFVEPKIRNHSLCTCNIFCPRTLGGSMQYMHIHYFIINPLIMFQTWQFFFCHLKPTIIWSVCMCNMDVTRCLGGSCSLSGIAWYAKATILIWSVSTLRDMQNKTVNGGEHFLLIDLAGRRVQYFPPPHCLKCVTCKWVRQ